jgi:hypothetical protein
MEKKADSWMEVEDCAEALVPMGMPSGLQEALVAAHV